MAEVNKARILKLSDKPQESCIPSGIGNLDNILGGGFFRGRVTEISGNPGIGKTYLATKFMSTLSDEYKVLYCDAEFSLNVERVKTLGANPDNIDYVADSRLEEVAELIFESIDEYDVIILDSLASLIPMTVADQEIGSSANIGLFARLIKQFVMKMRPRLANSKTAFIVINQMRKPIGMYATVELPGGQAFAHVCDVRLKLSSNGNDKKSGYRIIHAETTKNKMAQPFVQTVFKLYY